MIFTGFYTDWLWFDSVDQTEVFTVTLITRLALFGSFGLTMAVVLAGTLWIAYRFRPSVPPLTQEQAGLERYRMALDPFRVIIPLGIAAGLFLGKQVGIFGSVWLAVKFGIGVGEAGEILFFEDRGAEAGFGEDHHACRRLQKVRAGAGADHEEEGILHLAVQPDDPGQAAEHLMLAAFAQNGGGAASGRQGKIEAHAATPRPIGAASSRAQSSARVGVTGRPPGSWPHEVHRQARHIDTALHQCAGRHLRRSLRIGPAVSGRGDVQRAQVLPPKADHGGAAHGRVQALQHIATRSFPSGLVQSHYRVSPG